MNKVDYEKMCNLLAEKGIMKNDFCKRCGISQHDYSCMINGSFEPDQKTIYRMNSVLGVTSDEYFLKKEYLASSD